jgi:protein associated with RNAse G/E
MRKVRVLSKKYDGSLRDEYETYLYADTNEHIILFSRPGLRYWDYRKNAWFEAQDGLIEIYPRRKLYNVWHIAEQVSNTNLMYVNIALPASLREGTMEWVDLDLDYRVHLDNSVELLDESEFELNSQRFGYPPKLIERVQAVCREIEAGLTQQIFPFDYNQQVKLYNRIMGEL